MKASEVTKAMLDAFDENIDTSLDSEQKIIAAAVNAALGDPTPITAEWLVARGWEQYGDGFVKYAGSSRDAYVYIENSSDGCVLAFGSNVSENISYFPPAKTIGQLRALEIGLGLRD
jgi:hypothetical protein